MQAHIFYYRLLLSQLCRTGVLHVGTYMRSSRYQYLLPRVVAVPVQLYLLADVLVNYYEAVPVDLLGSYCSS